MSDRYRRQLSGYRPKPLAEPASSTDPQLDPEKATALLGYVRRLLAQQARAEQQSRLAAADERRGDFRRPYPQLMVLTPCDTQMQPRVEEAVQVVGKDLSVRGVGFIHTRAIREPKVILTFHMDKGQAVCVLTAVRRVQPIRQGLYLIGGEFERRLQWGPEISPAKVSS